MRLISERLVSNIPGRRAISARVLLLISLLFAWGCGNVRYEHQEFTDLQFALPGASTGGSSGLAGSGKASLRGTFGDEVDGVVKKGSPYTLLVSLPADDPGERDGILRLSRLELDLAEDGATLHGPTGPLEGKRVTKTDGEERIYFSISGLSLPHERLRLRFTVEWGASSGPSSEQAGALEGKSFELVFEPESSSEESPGWLDRILSV